MQIILIILINIFMGAALYLLISLKLERSASEFHSKKLRKEMDEIMKEFNAAADRNISLLENKITVMKRLLEYSGDIQSVDFTVGDTSESQKNTNFDSSHVDSIDSEKKLKNTHDFIDRSNAVEDTGHSKKGLPIFISRGIYTIYSQMSGFLSKFYNKEGISPLKGHNAEFQPVKKSQVAVMPEDFHEEYSEKFSEEYSIEKTLSKKSFQDISGEVSDDIEVQSNNKSLQAETEEAAFTEEEIAELLTEHTDRHSLIMELYTKGCSMEKIAHYCGIPAGEVRLVLNLNNIQV
jgi:hypothetical protein